ncbi:MAG: hypothetical protein JWN14_2743 [Chthonomonadales bacterium]|nr:hypothetical protein [Chthonomonadales bacterium]
MRLNFLLFGAAVVLLSTGIRAQDTPPAPKPDKDGFYTLFNGKDLNDWKPSEHPETFRIEEGNLVVNGQRAHLYYMGPVKNHEFKNFHLKAELMSFPKANSGIYFHTAFQEGGWPDKGFECQVNETHGDPKKTGGLYNVKDVMNQSPAKNNEWYTYDIIVKGKTVTLKINGKTTTEWTQPDDWKGPEGMPGRVLSSGTIAIQGHDPGSKVLYRSIKIQPLK